MLAIDGYAPNRSNLWKMRRKPHRGTRLKRVEHLVDSGSSSASEIVARAVQLEKRDIVIGDRTAVAVRQSREHSLQLGHDRGVMFGVSVTSSDLIMIPDEVVLPPPQALAAGVEPEGPAGC